MFGIDTDLGYPTGIEAPLGSVDDLNETTRWMCSRVLVNMLWARVVFERLCIPGRGAVAPAPGVDLEALAGHAAWAIHDERTIRARVTQLLGIAVVALAATVPLVLGGGPWHLTLMATGLSVLAAAAWSIERRATRAAMARRIITGGSTVEPRGIDLIDARQLDRVTAANAGNLLVYHERRTRAETPERSVFPGYGRVAVAEVRVPVDLSRPLDRSRPLGRVRPYELLRHLARTVPRYIDRTRITDHGDADVTAHVRETEVPNLPELLDTDGGTVRAQASPDFVRRAADEPTRSIRAYVRTQAIGHGGHLVTTIHLSAVAGSTGLSLNFVVHALAPLHPAWEEARDVPPTVWRRRWWIATRGRPWNLIVTAPRDWHRFRGLERQAKRPVGARRGSFGARGGLRWIASYNSGLAFNERVDLQRQVNDLMRALFSETRVFLEAHNIDSKDLREDEAAVLQVVSTSVTTVIGAVFTDTNVEGNVDASIKILEDRDDA